MSAHPTHVPVTVAAFDKMRDRFTAWLIERGSEILAPTNPYEVLRFRGATNVDVIYRDKSGCLTLANGASDAVVAFISNGVWRAGGEVEKRFGSRKRASLFAALEARDGRLCVYCGKRTDIDDATIEHFVAKTHGGPDHLANLMLAHQVCNRLASHLSAREKIEAIVKMRSAP